MAKLNDEQRAFVVQRLAMFDTPTQVADAVKEEFGIEIDRQAIRAYNPDQTRPAKKWCALFDATRKKFLESVSDIPIANRAVRLRSLQRMAIAAEHRKNYQLAAQLHEQAAKEVGEVYTNRQKLEHTGKDGLPFGGVTVEIHNSEGGPPSSVQVIG